MKFGLMSQLQVPKPWAEDSERKVYWQNLDHVVAAEHAGFSYFWLTEQHFFAEIGHSASPEMFLAALSQRTRRIRLGFAVILMPCHNPFMIAERVATLDVLSNGRCEFGAGRGTASYVVEGLGFSAEGGIRPRDRARGAGGSRADARAGAVSGIQRAPISICRRGKSSPDRSSAPTRPSGMPPPISKPSRAPVWRESASSVSLATRMPR